MTTHSTSAVRRYAAVGTAIALVAGSAVMGIGATTASAAEPTSVQDTATPDQIATPDQVATPGQIATPDQVAAPDTTQSAPGAEAEAEVDAAEVDAAEADAAAAAAAADSAADADALPAEADEPAAAPAADTLPAEAPTAGDTGVADTTAAEVEDVAFATTTSATNPRLIEVTAGTTLAESIRVARGSGTITYALGYSDPSDVEPDTDSPDRYLPIGTTFDTTTATLTGTVTSTGRWAFAVVASNGTSQTTEYVEVSVEPSAPVAVEVTVTDQSSNVGEAGAGRSFSEWFIARDGGVTTLTFPAAPDAAPFFTDGGRPTITQGGSLFVFGTQVDAYGNPATPYDAEGNAPAQVVTSDHPSDQTVPEENSSATAVTFPTASTHVLTVTIDGQSLSFPVTVVPRVATAAAVTPATPRGQLAFTGSDATDALPWAIAMLAAGAALVGVRTIRRRVED